MKYQLFTYEKTERVARSGIAVGTAWFDLGDAASVAGCADLAAASLDEVVGRWASCVPELDALAAGLAADPDRYASAALDAASIVLRSPFARPGAIYAAGANYRDHVEAMGRALNQKLVLDPKKEGVPPWHFLKSGAATLSGHRGEVTYPANTERLDWEAELAVVIGRRAAQVGVGSALDHVAGYMCANDLSARDHLVRHGVDPSSPFRFDWIGHKCFNGSCPLGPVFTPAQFVRTPENLAIKLWVNGELRQDSNTSNHLYGVAEQIAYLSERVDLLPGDVILTGTPAGVGMETGTFLQRGDVTRVWIETLGELETRIV
ncbi:fumarylacetoacetate hydrolase family protein [Variovorax sp. OAS795]|uniref:fumarylacetoacetate hydrolase family protein n=1 Tax=Variovorax sp. OAS795 TaxID=3034231 RepID=UPI003395473C